MPQILAANDVLSVYPFRTAQVPTGGERDTVVFSQYAMTEQRLGLESESTGWFSMPPVSVHAFDQEILMAGVHVCLPLKDSSAWYQGLDAIGSWVDAHLQAPPILAGDFNSTCGHQNYRESIVDLRAAGTDLPLATWPDRGLALSLVEIVTL